MKVHETTWKNKVQEAHPTNIQTPDIKESSDFIIDQYGCKLFSEAAKTHVI